MLIFFSISLIRKNIFDKKNYKKDKSNLKCWKFACDKVLSFHILNVTVNCKIYKKALTFVNANDRNYPN